MHTPRFWGQDSMAGVLDFLRTASRPCRTSWLIVGIVRRRLSHGLNRAKTLTLYPTGPLLSIVGSGTGFLPGLGDRVVFSVHRLRHLRERRGRHLDRGLLLTALAQDLHPGVVAEPGPGRDEPAHDHVLLEPAQVVDLAADGGLGQDPGGLLEGRGRDEAVGG